MSASVLTSPTVSGSPPLLARVPSNFISGLKAQIAQQCDVIRDLRHQIQRWNVEGAEWNRSKLDMRQLVDLQKGELARLRAEVVNAMTRAEKAEEKWAKMAEKSKKTEREAVAAKEVDRDTLLRRELDAAVRKAAELASAAESAKGEVKGAQAEIITLKATVERDAVIIRGVHEERIKLQSKLEVLESQKLQADEISKTSLAEAMNRMKELEEDHAKRMKGIEDEKMRMYGELQLVKAEIPELRQRNEALQEQLSRMCAEEKATMSRLTDELQTTSAEVSMLAQKNEILKEKLRNGRQALSSRPNPACTSPSKAVHGAESRGRTLPVNVEAKSPEKRKALGPRADPDFFPPSKKRQPSI